MSELVWKRSSRCSIGDCLLVAETPDGVRVRDSKSGVELAFDRDEWAAFLAGVRNGEFDLPLPPSPVSGAEATEAEEKR